MATLSSERFTRKDGTTTVTYRVLTGGGKRPRRTIRLGEVNAEYASVFRSMVADLETAAETGVIGKLTAAWVASLSDRYHKRLVAAGLLAPREMTPENAPATTLGDLITKYIASRAKLKPNTVRNYKTTQRLLLEHFGENRKISTIHGGNARDFREWLLAKYSPATVSREIKRARQFFEYARDCKLITENPFAKIKAGSQRNSSRKRYVSPDVIERILDALPDNNWRLALVLARYAGLRIPSELKGLTWNHIDRARDRIVIVVPKKEHIDGHETREVPLFPEIKPYLDRAYHEAPDGSVHVLPKRFHADGYVFAGILRAVERAKVEPWPKLLVNLRASRETELLLKWPEHIVHAWLGHTKAVADAHYATVTDADFRRASGNYPAQNPAQSRAVSGHHEPSEQKETAVNLGIPKCTAVYVPPRGVEPRFSD